MLLIPYIKRAIHHQYCDLQSLVKAEKDKVRHLSAICSEDFKHKISEEQNCPKSTRNELLYMCQSQLDAIRRMYHELRERKEALQNVEDPHMRA
ncbi:hypothetical protein T12_13205 [Trichinella patagoniensis]|uniref:Uncharacterized protein n=1 Tax=Trichinella patagoniensis TaxID=990121 RepID=A0A0V0Z658_9BILA|nr:hypothetical protein T12_13205 [Trichinella patagoniensis]